MLVMDVMDAGSDRVEDMLEAMLPPREWVEESGVWTQHISTGRILTM